MPVSCSESVKLISHCRMPIYDCRVKGKRIEEVGGWKRTKRNGDFQLSICESVVIRPIRVIRVLFPERSNVHPSNLVTQSMPAGAGRNSISLMPEIIRRNHHFICHGKTITIPVLPPSSVGPDLARRFLYGNMGPAT